MSDSDYHWSIRLERWSKNLNVLSRRCRASIRWYWLSFMRRLLNREMVWLSWLTELTGTLDRELASMDDTAVTGLSSADTSQADFGMVPHNMVPYLWPQVEAILRDKGRQWLSIVSEEDVYRLLCTGSADLWCGMQYGNLDVVVVCMWERHSRAAYYHVCFVGGNDAMKYLSKGLEALERFASIMGATEITLDGRKGLTRVLRRYGYGSPTVRLRKSVKVLWRN